MGRRRGSRGFAAGLQVAGLVVLSVAVAALSAVVVLRNPDPPASTVTIDDLPSPTEVVGPPTALWIGDSYTVGTGAPDPKQAESCLTSAAMRWVCVTDAKGGTGWLQTGPADDAESIMDRLGAALAKYTPDVVVIDAGRNDADTPQVVDAARAGIERVHQTWPGAKLVLIAPYFMNSTVEPRPLLADLYRTEAERLGGVFVDPFADGWINGDSAALTIADGLHPNPKGHEYIAHHLVAALKSAGVEQGPSSP